MYRLSKFGATLPNFRYCESLLNTKCLTKIPGYARSKVTKTSKVIASRLQAKDMIPQGFTLVYRGRMDGYVHLAHQSSVILSILGVSSIYRALFIEDEPLQFPIETGISWVGIKSYTQLMIMNAAFFLMMFGMRQISGKYVLRMYYNPATDTFKAVKLGTLPMATRTIDFKSGIFERQTKTSFIPWLTAVYKANGTKIIFFEGGFSTSAFYNKLFKD